MSEEKAYTVWIQIESCDEDADDEYENEEPEEVGGFSPFDNLSAAQDFVADVRAYADKIVEAYRNIRDPNEMEGK